MNNGPAKGLLLVSELRTRELAISDLESCALIMERSFGRERFDRTWVLRTWPALLADGSLKAAVVENARGEIVAFGASVFVTRQFAKELARTHVPYVASYLVRTALLPQSPICARDDIARGNAGDGVDVFIIHSGHPEGFAFEVGALIKAQLMRAFLELHRGYQVASVMVEVYTPEDRSLFEATDFRPMNVSARHDALPAVYAFSRYQLANLETHVFLPLFVYHHPACRFGANEQELLKQALNGHTDQELAATLHLSLPAVKKRWTGILRKAEGCLPGVMVASNSTRARNARGMQRRHLLLRALRNRPEELQPYAWPAVK